MTTTYGTVDYYRDRLAAWSDDRDRLAAAVGMIGMAVDEEALLPVALTLTESEKLALVRNVLDALDQVRT